MGVFEKTLVEGSEIIKYIPQRYPIVMVDKLFEVSDNGSVSGLTVTTSNLFSDGHCLQDCGLIEHIAQSAALRIGYLFISKGEAVPLGFIGSVNKLEISDLPKIGEQMRTTIVVEQEFMGITLLSAVVRVGERILAECQMKVAVNVN